MQQVWADGVGRVLLVLQGEGQAVHHHRPVRVQARRAGDDQHERRRQVEAAAAVQVETFGTRSLFFLF